MDDVRELPAGVAFIVLATITAIVQGQASATLEQLNLRFAKPADELVPILEALAADGWISIDVDRQVRLTPSALEYLKRKPASPRPT